MSEGDKYSTGELKNLTIRILKEGGFIVSSKGDIIDDFGESKGIQARVNQAGNVELTCSNKANERKLIEYLDSYGIFYR